MSSSLLWELTKGYNAYLVNRNGVKLTRDPYSLNNRTTASNVGTPLFPTYSKDSLQEKE